MAGDLLNRNVNDCVDPEDHVMNIRAASALTPTITAITGAEADTGAYYDFSGVTPGDLLFHEAGANGRVATGISNDPIVVGGKSSVVLKQGFGIPHQFDIEASADQAVRADYQSIEVFSLKDDGTADTMPAPTPCIITSLQQATTTLTITLDPSTPYDGWVGTWANIVGAIDNRLNYFNLCIATVSLDRLTLTATVADESTLPTLTVGPYSGGTLGSATLTRDDQIGGARNGYSLRFSGTSTTGAALISRFDGDSAQKSGTLAGNQTLTVASRAVAFDVQSTGQVAPRPTSHYRMVADPDMLALMDRAADSVSAPMSPRAGRSNVKPWARGRYGMRLSMVAPASMPRPVAKIVSATKTASAVATIVTAAAHGLVTGNYVMTVGIRDTTNFANLTTAAAVTVVDATTFTVTIGSSATATSYGGSVILANGSYGQPGLVTQIVQSVARDAAGLVTVVGSGTWSGVAPGQYVNLYGVRDNATGADLGFDGVYYCLSTATTTMILGPVADIRAAALGPALANIAYPATPTGGVVTTTNCGGTVIVRTTTRSHDFAVYEWKQNTMLMEGQGTARPDKSMPVNLVALTSGVVVPVTDTPSATSGGMSSQHHLISAASTNATLVKSTPGTIGSVTGSNTNAAVRYLKVYNKATAPTVGTDTPIRTIMLPPNGTIHLDFPKGLRTSLGIGIGMTTGAAVADTGAVAAAEVISGMEYI